MDTLREREIAFRILDLGVDSATPAGYPVLTVIAAVAEMPDPDGPQGAPVDGPGGAEFPAPLAKPVREM
ncbi:hypothetical protein GCM10007382_04190 [Salinibacterium xinjiangense]|nr:hypothetical protein GCM10007382_04190 [Salinibacterium xinjiangense]